MPICGSLYIFLNEKGAFGKIFVIFAAEITKHSHYGRFFWHGVYHQLHS